MLKRLVELSLSSRGVVITLAVGFICYGLFVTSHAKLDVFPEFVQPQATVQTEAPGLAPEQVESLVTRPVESALNGAGDLDSIRSESSKACRSSPPFSRKARTSTSRGRCSRNGSRNSAAHCLPE